MLVETALASIRIDLLVGSCAGSLLAAFLASSVPTVVTAFVDMDPSSSSAFYWHSKQISGPPLCPIS